MCEAARGLLERSGSTRLFDTRSRIPLSIRVVDQDKAQAILDIDRKDRIDNLEALWPEFPRLVSSYFEGEWESNPKHKEIEKRRVGLIQDASRRQIPAPPILGWHQELLELSLHRTLNHLDIQLWRSGNPSIGMLREVAEAVAPEIDMYVRHWISRVVRPDLPLTSRLTEDSPLLGPLPDTDQAGWVRVGYYEIERLLSEESILANVTKTLRVSAGFGIPRPGEPYPNPGSLPFGMGETGSWRETSTYEPLFRAGPLVGLTYLMDFLGQLPILALPARLTNRLPIHGSDALGRLHLVDSGNAPCVTFRQWHVRPLGERLSQSANRNEGCDLIVRSDIWEAIRALFPGKPILPSFHRSEDEF